MGGFDQFVTTVPRLRIGQAVRVVGPYAGDWPVPCLVVGICYDAVSRRWNITIAQRDEIEAGYGSTDGFTEADLAEAPE